jgi:hypothetical protein
MEQMILPCDLMLALFIVARLIYSVLCVYCGAPY